MAEYLPLIMFAAVFVTLLAGYAVAPTLAGVALLAYLGNTPGVSRRASRI